MTAANITDVIHSLQSLDGPSSIDNAQRKRLLEALKTTQSRLETPLESMLRLGWVESSWMAALRIADQAGWFLIMSQSNGSPVSVKDIAAQSGADEDFTLRYLKHLAAMGTVEQTSALEFKNAALGEALARPPFKSFAMALTDMLFPGYLNLPEHFRISGYKTPQSAAEAPALKTLTGGQPLFTWMRAPENQHLAKAYMDMMSCHVVSRTPWPTRYPVSELMDDAQDGILVVDIGGNRGEDLQAVVDAIPELAKAEKPRLILQDQPHVIAEAKPRAGIDATAHDFFTEQPVKGARAYYMRNILHDWSFEDASRILAKLKPAMTPGYSKLLINETVVPDVGAEPSHTAADIGMMSHHAGRERTESDWRALLATSQLRIAKIWRSPGESDSIIEAEAA